MRFSSAIFFAGNALAVANRECFVDHSADLAVFADCANHKALTYCLEKLESFAETDVQSCYTSSGCSETQAKIEAHHTQERCEELVKTGELKKRFQAEPIPNMARAEAAAISTVPAKALRKRAAMSGTDCFETGKTSTSECPKETVSGKTTTGSCFPTEVTTSKCASGLICTLDASNNDICMEKKGMETGGIIVMIVFASFIALGIGALIFMCCKERKEQKRLAVKAETVALARAATKKQRERQGAAARAPLIRNGSGTSNPFQDQNRV